MKTRSLPLLALTSLFGLALTACTPSAPPAPPAPPEDPPIPSAPKEVAASAVEQARQANQVFVTLHAKPGSPALPTAWAGGDRWVQTDGNPVMLCLESVNSTPVLVALSIQGKDVDGRPTAPGKARLLELNKGTVVCPNSALVLQADAPAAIAWAVYPTNGQAVDALTKDGFLKDPRLQPGGVGLIRIGEPDAMAPRPEVWPGHPEATPPVLDATAQAALEQVLAARAKEEAERQASPKPEGVEATP